ncbi:MAG: transcription antitermination factor NusB, partial [Burkholderiales bacterium]
MVEVQRLASDVVGEVMAGRNLDSTLQAARRRHPALSAQDRAVLQDISYGTLRFLGELDAILDQLLQRPLKDERVRQ